MILEVIVDLIAGLFTLLAGLFPQLDTPGWVGTLSGHIATVTGQMAGLGVWLPFGPAGNATMLVLAALAASVVIRVVRIVVSLLTGGGGGAA